MKIGIVITLILVLSIFSTTFALADNEMTQGNARAVKVEKAKLQAEEKIRELKAREAEITSINSDELESLDIDASQVLDNLEDSDTLKRIGFANVWRGLGSINDGTTGYLVSVLWVKQAVAVYNSETKEVENVSRIRSFGTLFIPGIGNYKIVRDTTDANASDDSVNFYILPIKEKVRDFENPEENSIGTLSLEKQEEYTGLIKWKGYIAFESGDLVGSWNMDLATDNHVVRKSVVNDQGKKLGFWQRFAIWRR